MFCPKCGAPIKDGHRFCTACGFSVAEKQPTQKGTQKQAKGQAPANRPPQARPGKRPSNLQAAPKKRKSALGLLIGLVAGGLVLAAAAEAESVRPSPGPDSSWLVVHGDGADPEHPGGQERRGPAAGVERLLLFPLRAI